jgi:hypothetical protein
MAPITLAVPDPGNSRAFRLHYRFRPLCECRSVPLSPTCARRVRARVTPVARSLSRLCRPMIGPVVDGSVNSRNGQYRLNSFSYTDLIGVNSAKNGPSGVACGETALGHAELPAGDFRFLPRTGNES